jgi:hypothetical protein
MEGPQHGLAGLFGRIERSKGRADDLNGGPAAMERAPRYHEARTSMKARTGAALITDHERKAAASGVPYLHVLDGNDDAAELHAPPRISSTP